MPTTPGRMIVMPLVAETLSKGGIIQPGSAEDNKFRLKRGVVEECGCYTSKAGDMQGYQPDGWPLKPGTLVLFNSMAPWDHDKSIAIEAYNCVRYFAPENIAAFPGFEKTTASDWVASCKDAPTWFSGYKA